MKRIYRVSCLMALLVLVAATASFAQSTTGTPPFGSFSGSSFDAVNNANLNVHLTVPLISKPGRGMPFNYAIIYDSSVWFPVGSSGSQTWQSSASWGWGDQTDITTGYVTYNTIQHRCLISDPGMPREYETDPVYTGWAYHDIFGIVHSFFLTVIDGTCPWTNVTTGTANDGSGYTMTVGSDPSATVFSRSANKIYAPLQSQTGAGSITDSNGNQISVDSSRVFKDTLGSIVLSVTGTAPSPVTYTSTNSSGSPAAYIVKYTSYTVQTNFGCSGISEYGPTSQSLVSEIDLPNGTKYLFNYEATPGHAGNVTGRLASVTLPTGGTISYAYTGGSSGITCADGTAAGLTRTVSPGGAWTYTRSGTAPAWTTTIADPQSNQSVLNFQGIYETERQIKQGSSTLLETIFTCYNGAAPNCNSTAVSLSITQQSVYNLWANNQESRADTFYNAYGLVTETDEYQYGTNTPGPLARKTLVTYASFTNGNIADRPATVTVQDGSNHTKAVAQFAYDGSSLTQTSGVPQHDYAGYSYTNNVRGNPTSVGRCSTLSGNSCTVWLSSTATYNDLGNVLSQTDPAGNTTSISYTDNYSDGVNHNTLAYPTQITYPVTSGISHIVKAKYYYYTGLLDQSIDQNNQTTSYTYDSMNRLLSVSLPDGLHLRQQWQLANANRCPQHCDQLLL
jgi:YD repeat-containing protein